METMLLQLQMLFIRHVENQLIEEFKQNIYIIRLIGNRRSLISVQSTKRNTFPILCYVAILSYFLSFLFSFFLVSSIAPRPFDLRPSNFYTMTLPGSCCVFWKKKWKKLSKFKMAAIFRLKKGENKEKSLPFMLFRINS